MVQRVGHFNGLLGDAFCKTEMRVYCPVYSLWQR